MTKWSFKLPSHLYSHVLLTCIPCSTQLFFQRAENTVAPLWVHAFWDGCYCCSCVQFLKNLLTVHCNGLQSNFQTLQLPGTQSLCSLSHLNNIFHPVFAATWPFFLHFLNSAFLCWRVVVAFHICHIPCWLLSTLYSLVIFAIFFVQILGLHCILAYSCLPH